MSMRWRYPLLCWLLGGAASLTLLALPARAQTASERVVKAWQFNTPEAVAAWQAVRAGTPVCRAGALTTQTEGRDPQLIAPSFKLPVSPYQVLEIRMRSNVAGEASVFWSNTTEGKWGGYEEAKRTDFQLIGDGQFHDYRLTPFWHAEKQLISFRLDPPVNAAIAVESIRVLEAPAPPATETHAWDSLAEWRAIGSGKNAARLSPLLNLPATDWSWAACKVKAKTAGTGHFYWVSSIANGLQSTPFYVRPGEQLCNLDVAANGAWSGDILAVGLSLPEGAVLYRLSLEKDPQGPAAPEIGFFGLRDAINRAGRTAVLKATVRNQGGAATPELKARLTLAPGLTLAAGESAEKTTPSLEFGESSELTWQVRAARPGRYPVRLALAGAGSAPLTARTAVALTAPAAAAKSDYVPAPQPVASDYEVGVYYYPGWATYQRWSVLNNFPERRPVLGYYREGDPEVLDWQIKWMAEHGIKFIIYDWYWVKGARHHEHAIHQGLFNARYKNQIKFCLLWANHNPAGTSSEEDLLNVTDFWLKNYFKLPNYYTINGRPVVVIFSPGRLTADMGVEKVKAAFQKMRERVKAAGLPDLYLVACTSGDAGTLQAVHEEGYDAASGYNYPSAGAVPGDLRPPYKLAVDGYEKIWKQIAASGLVDYIPVTDPGWDSRPWHGENRLVRTGKTPALFQQMLQRARDFVDKNTPAGRPRVVFVEAWNELGEGDYVEPHREWGFAHLDAIRSVFAKAPAKHVDVTPVDVGLGPYELTPDPPRTAWEFEQADQLDGWTEGYNVKDRAVRDGALWATATSRDPALLSAAISASTRKYRAVEIRMKMDRGDGAQLYWSTDHTAISNANRVDFAVQGDNQYHVYRLNLRDHPRWRGKITRLRLDPNAVDGSTVAVDYVRLLAE